MLRWLSRWLEYNVGMRRVLWAVSQALATDTSNSGEHAEGFLTIFRY